MAGSYPDVPGYRFAYDKDGTGVFTTNGGVITNANSSQIAQLCSHNGYSNNVINYNLTFLFPEPRNITGLFMNINGGSYVTTEYSTDTASGIDGTWQPVTGLTGSILANKINSRTDIKSVNLTNIIGLRTTIQNSFRTYHIYGSIPTANSRDRLRIVDLSNNDIAAQLDFGDIRQRNNSTKQFKVVNNSATKTANNITVTLDVPSDASPSLIGQYQLSTDNTAFANAINIGTLAPGASSGTLYLRNNVSATAQLSLWDLRIIASPNTWS